ncbi:DUF2165 family protein [Methylacidiphilum caldifontis]|nr:DUF2165 domain-containing protein [Methylacidiphilum caldifontis]
MIKTFSPSMLHFTKIPSLLFWIRLSKMIILLFFSFYFLLIALNNILDYQANFQFVQHILLMDSIDKVSPLHSRAWKSPNFHGFVYTLLIGWEAICGLVLFLGTAALFKNLFRSKEEFQQAKRWGSIGLFLGLCGWLFFFILGGGEWFQMWRSTSFNALPQAFRMAILILLFLSFFIQTEPE